MKSRSLLIGLFLVAGCIDASSDGLIGGEAPEFAARTLSGDSLRLSELRGNPILLNIWATWCIPCRKEMPELEALHKTYAARGLRVIGVSVDEGSADDAVRAYTKEFGITYTILRDPGELVSAVFTVPGVPATFLIDRDGRVRWRHLGPFTSENPELQSALKAAL
ncbi:MAG TPA: TlpA disulfide reductase family protein [Longimicrobiales bacterium]|nr:TlpA disulfide reductase family protein [Longimicrobiales bacterium]